MKRYLLATAVVTSLLFIASCRKETAENNSSLNTNTENSNKKQFFHVSNVQELYQVVNDPDNAGSQIILEPGVYTLDASYPNGGRLELQTDMGLQGQPGRPESVLIDESLLPVNSFRLSPTTSTRLPLISTLSR